MKNPFRQGHLDIDFSAPVFRSPLQALAQSGAIFFRQLPFFAAVTLLVFLPGTLAVQWVEYLVDIPVNGLTAYLLMDVVDLVFGALAVPAVVYGLVRLLRAGRTAPLGECLRWGRRQWGRTLWNQFQAEITILLWSALLIVPGVIAMVRLVFTSVIVAVEGDRTTAVLARSRELTRGRGWRIFFTFLPVAAVEFALSMVVLDALVKAGVGRVTLAAAETLLAVGSQWNTVLALVIYLGVTERPSR